MKFLKLAAVAVLLACSQTPAFAGVSIENASGKLQGFAAKVQCGSGLTCSIAGARVTIQAPGSSGTSLISGAMSTFAPFPVSAVTGVGTSTTAVVTDVYVTKVFIPANAQLTGIAVNNAATVGTNKYIVALFNASGAVVANSALAGVTTAGASAWQKIPFTTTPTVAGPAVYYVGLYVNGTTDTFYSIPAAGEYVGAAGLLTGQVFGTVSSITPPTTFTAGQGPIVHTY